MYNRIPDYLAKISTNIKIIVFVTIFSLVFVNVYSPFQVATLYKKLNSIEQFFYSAAIILCGTSILLISRIIMCKMKHILSLSIIQYCLWLLCEILFIAFLYTIINIYLLEDQRIFASIFQHSLIIIPLLLAVPYIVSYLYLSLQDKEEKINDLLLQENTHTISEGRDESGEIVSADAPSDNIINFTDEKGVLKLSVKKEYVCYIESANNYVNIYYIHKDSLKRYMIRNTLKNLEPMLNPYGFVRCHRSYMVNFKKVKIVRNEKDGFFIDLDQDGVGDIPISKTYAEQIMKLFSTKS